MKSKKDSQLWKLRIISQNQNNMNIEKIQKVIKKMLTENWEINSVVRGEDDYGEEEDEFYFTYPDHKYLWSVSQDMSGKNYFFYYPSSQDRSVFIRFVADELGASTKEDLRSLFEILKGKIFGFDVVLDEILTEKEIPF